MIKLKQPIIIVAIIVILNSCGLEQGHQKTADELRLELKMQEQSSPTRYLSATGSMKQNITREPDLFHHTETDGYIISGTIKNTSTIAKFKDVIVTVNYLSETQTVIESKEYVLYKYFSPNSETLFNYKVYPPEGFKDFSVDIKGATPVN